MPVAGDALDLGVDHVCERREDVGLPTGPVAVDASNRRGHSRLHAVEVNFDGITYAKGASVLKQLAAYVGVDAFLRAMRVYFRRYEFGNSTLADLLRTLEQGPDATWQIGRPSGSRRRESTVCARSSSSTGRVAIVIRAIVQGPGRARRWSAEKPPPAVSGGTALHGGKLGRVGQSSST